MTAELLPLTSEQRARLTTRSRPRRSGFEDVVLPELPSVPGMISDAEKRYLYWLTSSGYVGRGSVVEVGSWLGLSTIHLGAGLRDAGFPSALHCFDQFIWRRSHARKQQLPIERGDDFQPYFERNVRPVYPAVRVTKTEIRDLVWDGDPIEILFLDAPKQLADISATLAAFGPALVPGLSLVVFQDYLHAPSYALAAVVSRLQDQLELLHVIQPGCSAGFMVRRPLEVSSSQPIDWNFARWTREQILNAWEQILAPLPPAARARLEPGLYLHLYDACGRKAASEAARELARAGPLNPLLFAEWQRFMAHPLSRRYRPLVRAMGVHEAQKGAALFGRLRARFRRFRSP